MTERRVSVRLGIIGGKDVEATFENLGTRGAQSMQRLGDASEQAFNKVRVSSQGGGGSLQNVGYQIQDFAVQVGAGTSATQALSQQLPQLLSSFGLIGVLAGTASAILIPLVTIFFNLGEEAETAGEAIKGLEGDIRALQTANDIYSTKGIQTLIDKYGELDAAVLTLIERQRTFAENQAMTSARELATSFSGEFETLFAFLEEYESRLEQIATATGATEEQAQSFAAIKESVLFLNEEFGITIEQARQVQDAFADLQSAQTVEEMVDATAELNGLLADSSIASSDLAEQLLQSEDALRQLNAEGSGVNSWLDAAIGGASGLASELWDAATAAMSVVKGQNAAAAKQRNAATQFSIDNDVYSGRGEDPRRFMDGGDLDGVNNTFDVPLPRPPRGGVGGRRGGDGGRDLNADDLREKARLFELTRNEAEKYAAEIANIDRLYKEADIDADLHARAIERVKDKYAEAADKGMTFGEAIKEISQPLVQAAIDGRNLAEALEETFVKIAADLAATQLQTLLLSAFAPVLQSFGLTFDSPILSAGPAAAMQPAALAQSQMVSSASKSRDGVVVNFNGGGVAQDNVEVKQSRAPDGGRQLDVWFKGMLNKAINDGGTDRTMSSVYGVRRVPR